MSQPLKVFFLLKRQLQTHAESANLGKIKVTMENLARPLSPTLQIVAFQST